MMRKKTNCILYCAAVFIALCGCQSHNKAIEARLQHDIDRCHQDFRSRGLILRQFATNILSAVTSANVFTLKTPQFVSAAIGRDDDGEYRLHVYWLEDVPSVDSVELALSKTNSTGIIALSASDKERNLTDSKVSVVFMAYWIWSSTNGIWNQLEKVDDVTNFKVRLLKADKPVTDWYPVPFYRLDHWMGSKKVVEISTGPSTSLKSNK